MFAQRGMLMGVSGGGSHLSFCFNKNVKSHVSTRGQLCLANFSQSFHYLLYSCFLVGCVCMVPYLFWTMFASVSAALTQSLRWDIYKSKAHIHVSFNLFKLMQVCASDQSGLCILPHKSQRLPLRMKQSQYYRRS